MQPKRVWTLIALAGLAAVTVMRSDRDLDKGDGDRAGSRSARNSTEKDPLVPSGSATSAIRPGVGSAWLLFRTHWSAVLRRVYQKMNENRLLAVAAGVVFYGLLALFPAITAFVSLYGLMADPSTIHERLSLATGVLPQGAYNILNEQLTRLTSHRTSALSVEIHLRAFRFAPQAAIARARRARRPSSTRCPQSRAGRHGGGQVRRRQFHDR